MRRTVSTTFLFVAISIMAIPMFARHLGLTGRDIVDMWDRGASPAAIVQAVRTTGVYQPLTRYDIDMMQSAGMPPAFVNDLVYEFDRNAVYAAPPRRYAQPYYAPGVYMPRPILHFDLGIGRGHGYGGHSSYGYGGGHVGSGRGHGGYGGGHSGH